MVFKVPGLEAFAASLSHCARSDIGATTKVVHGAASMVVEVMGNLGRFATAGGPDSASCIATSDLCECIRLSISMVLPSPISGQVSVVFSTRATMLTISQNTPKAVLLLERKL